MIGVRPTGGMADAIVAGLAEGLVQFDERGRIEYLNPAAERLFGYPREELLGRDLAVLIPSPDREWHRGGIETHLARGTGTTGPIGREVIGCRRDGAGFPMYLSVSEARDQGRRVFVAVVHDLSEHKRTEETRFRALADRAPLMIWMSRPDRRCTYFSEGWLRFTGRDLQEELGYGWTEDVHPEDLKRCVATYESAFDALEPLHVEYRIKRHDGAYRWILDTATPYHRADGQFAGYLGGCIDITERKEAEAVLQDGYTLLEHRVAERTAELARSNGDLEQFAYVASHDLQEPLRAVAGCVHLLAQRYRDRLDGRAEDLMRHAVEGAVRMQALINDLLAYSRIGTRAEAPSPTDCGAVLCDALARLRAAIAESGAEIKSDPLPTVMAEPTQMTQLFQNLVGNAIKFRGDAPPAIHIAALRLAGEWRISVKDNGIGMEPEYADRVFRIFQRLHTRSEYPGTGIGLAICKRVVERWGGRIWIESAPGRGSTFHFTVPAGEQPA
ncbi:MAG: PAS domain S-box protein [Pseudomonadota bacterium]|nr:PAS domain S-box protein [Pseudomonadota bacterium]